MYSEKYTNQEVNVLIYVFVEIEHGRSFLENLVHEYPNMKKKNDKSNYFNDIKNVSVHPKYRVEIET